MPTLKPFAALRYAPARVDLAAVLGDGSDDPRHVRRILEVASPADAARVALFVAEWRRAGVLVRDEQPSITIVRRRSSDGSEALGFFAAIPLTDVAGREDAVRAAVLETARIAVEPALIEGNDESGRMKRTLDGAADREPDASLVLGGDTLEAFVVDDETTAARLSALPFSNARIAAGGDALAAHAAWWAARPRTDDDERSAAAHGLAFFVEQRDAWTRVPTGLALAPLVGALS